MTTEQFYRRSLALPPFALFILALLPDTNNLVTLKGVGFFGLALGGIPYALLCIWLIRYSTTHSLRSFERALKLAPLLLLPLVAAWTVLIVIGLDNMSTRPDLGGLKDETNVGLVFALFACGYALLVGYVSVAVVFLLKRILSRAGAFSNTQV